MSIFLPGDLLLIFGSRTDITRKGGDIDLYIETFVSDMAESLLRKRKILGRFAIKAW